MAVGIFEKFIEDAPNGHVSTLTLTADGYEGTRYARVRANDIADAITTPGLPRLGDKWSPSVGAICRSVGNPVCYEGETTNGFKYWVVQCQYDSPRFGAAATTTYRKPGDAITELVTSTEQQTIYYPVDQFGTVQRIAVDAEGAALIGITPDETPIANGDGVSIEVGSISATVSVWHELNQAPNYARFTRLSRPSKVNMTAVSLPPLERSTQRLTFENRQVRYRTWKSSVELSGEPGPDGLPTPLLRLDHSLALAENHDVIWQAQNAAGEPNGRYWKDRVYADADMTGLWP